MTPTLSDRPAPPGAAPHLAHRPQSLGEEIANATSHGLGFVLAVASLAVLVRHADGAAQVVGACVFSGTMMLLYLVSTLYHALPAGRAKQPA